MKPKLIVSTLILAASLNASAFGEKTKTTQQSPATTDAEANKMAKGAINGMVKDIKNNPLENVVIVIAETTAQGPIKEIAPMTNAKGEFSFSGLPPGEYTLRANAPGYTPKDKKVTVEGTKTSSVDFQMTK